MFQNIAHLLRQKNWPLLFIYGDILVNFLKMLGLNSTTISQNIKIAKIVKAFLLQGGGVSKSLIGTGPFFRAQNISVVWLLLLRTLLLLLFLLLIFSRRVIRVMFSNLIINVRSWEHRIEIQDTRGSLKGVYMYIYYRFIYICIIYCPLNVSWHRLCI